jgi:hypothetical protein
VFKKRDTEKLEAAKIRFKRPLVNLLTFTNETQHQNKIIAKTEDRQEHCLQHAYGMKVKNTVGTAIETTGLKKF